MKEPEVGTAEDEASASPPARMGSWLGVWSARKYPLETLYLRRLVLLEGLAWGHGLAVGYLHHLISLWTNQEEGYVIAGVLMAEFNSHRTHAAILQSLTQPGPLTRLVLLALQVRRLQLCSSPS